MGALKSVHDTFLGWLAGWTQSPSSDAWVTVLVARARAAWCGRPWLPLAPPHGAVLPPAPHRDKATVGAITSSSYPRTATLPRVAATDATAMPCYAAAARSATAGMWAVLAALAPLPRLNGATAT